MLLTLVVFVQLAPGIDGLVHISDLSWTEHIKHPADMLKKVMMLKQLLLTSINKNEKSPWALNNLLKILGKLLNKSILLEPWLKVKLLRSLILERLFASKRH